MIFERSYHHPYRWRAYLDSRAEDDSPDDLGDLSECEYPHNSLLDAANTLWRTVQETYPQFAR